MSTEIALNDRGFLRPSTMGEAMQFAEVLAKSTMVPREYQRSAANILVAIQMGAELGLAPLQALQAISVINGKPAIYGDALMALVRSSRLCESVAERYEGEGDSLTAVCVAHRRGQSEPIVGRFSVEDAKRAKLWGKSGPWTDYPKIMLKHRARGFCLRDGFADLLHGVISAEEAGDYPRQMKDVTPQQESVALADDLDTFAGGTSNAASEAETEPEPSAYDLDADHLLAAARASALSGSDVFRRWYIDFLDDEQRLALRPHVKQLQATAQRADEQRRADDRDPSEREPVSSLISRMSARVREIEGGEP